MTARIGIVGDLNPTYPSHREIQAARDLLGPDLAMEWVPTDGGGVADILSGVTAYDGLWIAPGSPYADDDAVLEVIRHARERALPLLGTCGGLQYAVLEFLRNAVGGPATHAETDGLADSNASRSIRSSCSACPAADRGDCPSAGAPAPACLRRRSAPRQLAQEGAQDPVGGIDGTDAPGTDIGFEAGPLGADGRVGPDGILQMRIHHRPQPVLLLLRTPRRQRALGLQMGSMIEHRLPDLVQAGAGLRRARQHRWAANIFARQHQSHRRAQVPSGHSRP